MGQGEALAPGVQQAVCFIQEGLFASFHTFVEKVNAVGCM